MKLTAKQKALFKTEALKEIKMRYKKVRKACIDGPEVLKILKQMEQEEILKIKKQYE
jgi:hypothetical protein